jgi:hypothetical protein
VNAPTAAAESPHCSCCCHHYCLLLRGHLLHVLRVRTSMHALWHEVVLCLCTHWSSWAWDGAHVLLYSK